MKREWIFCLKPWGKSLLEAKYLAPSPIPIILLLKFFQYLWTAGSIIMTINDKAPQWIKAAGIQLPCISRGHLASCNFQLRMPEDVTENSIESHLHCTQLRCFSANLILDVFINLKKTRYDLELCSTGILTYSCVEQIKIFLLWTVHYYQPIYNTSFLSSSLFCNVDNDDYSYYTLKQIAFLTCSHWLSVPGITIQKLNCFKYFYHIKLHWSKALQNSLPRIFIYTVMRTEVFISLSKGCGVLNSCAWG